MYRTTASSPFANPFGARPPSVFFLWPRRAPSIIAMQRSAAIQSITTCLVGEMSITRLPMWIGSQCGSSYEHTHPVSRHGYSRWCESVMCGRMKSLPSADMIQQKRFSDHRKEEVRGQTNECSVERQAQNIRQNREHHQHNQPQHRAHPPAKEELARSGGAALPRRQECERADLYCESQSSAQEQRLMLRVTRENESQEQPGVEDDCRGYSGEQCDRFDDAHRRLSSSSFF